MNDGVKVLIARMKTNPEDFGVSINTEPFAPVKKGKFIWVQDQIESYLLNKGPEYAHQHLHMTMLDNKDLVALIAAFKELRRDDFTNRVMHDLFKEEVVEELDSGPMSASSAFKKKYGGSAIGAGGGSGSILGNQYDNHYDSMSNVANNRMNRSAQQASQYRYGWQDPDAEYARKMQEYADKSMHDKQMKQYELERAKLAASNMNAIARAKKSLFSVKEFAGRYF